ncbi:MAG: hypothetical protein QOC55_2331 [Thermoleophilaceae bacterium]|nr:hypothetical protein [Thermoleophilaceae bacterium]
MRQLHVVALSEDGRSVLLAPTKGAKAGTFSLSLDGKLAAAVRGDVPRVGEQQAREAGVTPKEIQARLRAGESVEQIAAAAGVPAARVERFAGPVLSERERIIDEARAAFVSRNRHGVSKLPLGDAVEAALAETSGLRADSVTWTARRLDSGHWLVQLSYVARARTRTASWVYEPHTRSVTASDSASAALGHVGDEPGPHRLAAAAPRSAAAPRAARPAKKVAKKTVKKKAAKKVAKKTVKKAAKKVVKKAVVARPVAKPVKKKASTPKPAKKAVAKKTAKPATKKAAPKAKAAPPRKSPARRMRSSAAAEAVAAVPAVQWGPPVDAPPTLRVVPQPEPVEAAPEPAAVEPRKKRAAGERAHVPDWADVLLGTAPKRSDD